MKPAFAIESPLPARGRAGRAAYARQTNQSDRRETDRSGKQYFDVRGRIRPQVFRRADFGTNGKTLFFALGVREHRGKFLAGVSVRGPTEGRAAGRKTESENLPLFANTENNQASGCEPHTYGPDGPNL
jgi:hypothetical protein